MDMMKQEHRYKQIKTFLQLQEINTGTNLEYKSYKFLRYLSVSLLSDKLATM